MARKNSFILSKNSSVLFVTFSMWQNDKRLPTNGSVEPMRDFLVPKIKKLVLIDQPHPGSDRVIPRIEDYKFNNFNFTLRSPSVFVKALEPMLRYFNKNSTQPVFKIRDFLSVFDWSLRDKTVYDYCICLESINTLAAIFLRRMGRVKEVIYYVSDYSPKRYGNKYFNNIYLMLDRFSAQHADFIWDVSPAMQKARISAGLVEAKSAKVIIVANGLLPDQIKSTKSSNLKDHSMVYMGTVGSENGPDIAIKALKLVRKSFPDATLDIIGGTEKDHVWLKKIIEKLSLGKSVIFHGFVESQVEMAEIMRKKTLGVAPYKSIPGSIRYYADAGKIRAYCAAGLPVVTSKVPPLGIELSKRGGAVMVDDDPKDFAEAIINIFNDEENYLKLRKNAILFAKNSTWENTFTNAFKKM